MCQESRELNHTLCLGGRQTGTDEAKCVGRRAGVKRRRGKEGNGGVESQESNWDRERKRIGKGDIRKEKNAKKNPTQNPNQKNQNPPASYLN